MTLEFVQQRNPKTGQWIVSDAQQWYLQKTKEGKNVRVGYFDIEFQNLKPNFGYMTMWSIKERDSKNVKQSCMTREELYDKNKLDRRIVKEFWDEVAKYDLICGYYSSGCDVPYTKSRAIHFKMNNLIQYKQKYHLDLYFALRDKVGLSSHSLKKMCEWVGIKGKVDLTDDEWVQANLLEKQAFDKLKERNKYDVIILEKLHKMYEPYVKFNRNYL